MESLPSAFIRTVTGIFGADGARFLERLPALLDSCAARWSLTLEPHFPDLSINYVAPALLPDGTEAVLKLCVPNLEFRCEAGALSHFDGRGAIRLLAWDMEDGAMLLERPRPGTPLWEASEVESVEAALTVMQRIWQTAPEGHGFPSVADWAAGLCNLRKRYDGGTGPLPADLVDLADGYFAELLASETHSVVLHGDLHHGNILRAGREPWLVIDPKGVVGEPAFEVTAFMLNPDLGCLPEAEARKILDRRLDRFSEALGCGRERLRRWTLARAVLSAWWSIEDHGEWAGAIRIAGLLR